MNFPTIADTVQMLAMRKKKQGWTNAQVATSLNAFGWNGQWTEARVDALFEGRAKATDNETGFFKLYLLAAFYDYNSTA